MLKPAIIIFHFLFLWPIMVHAQQNDSLLNLDDSVDTNSLQEDSVHKDSLQTDTLHPSPVTAVPKKYSTWTDIVKENIFLNTSSQPVSLIQSPKRFVSKDLVFYILAVLLLFLGILKVSWPRYFSNLIRVFFNTSLRQGQLTDQLLQARLPSMFFNLFFVFISGWYIYLLLNHFGKINYDNWQMLLSCIICLLLVYIVKFCTLKFAGWLTGYKEEAETYIFIVFLINKIISLCLVPVVIIIPFSSAGLVNITIIISYVIIALMFLMRFFRSYGLLQTKLKVSGFHFFLYIISIEVLPLLLIYKYASLVFMRNNL
ncbi:MAG: DUF4271 domain-containing protein [Ferruginibacter sp.]